MNDFNEEWRIIEEFPNYSVSNLGRIKNNSNDYILIGGRDKNGYRQVTLQGKNKQFSRRVCRLVAKAFIPNPDNLPHVNHKDEDVSNDNLYNLEWCTIAYNNNYKNKGDTTRKKVLCIEKNKIYKGMRIAARDLGLTHTNIGRACSTGLMYGGFHWRLVEDIK